MSVGLSVGWPARFWEQQLRDLFVRTDMQADEFERLLEAAHRGERPDHPSLPAYAPFETELLG
jgi:hypothetical protein